ncbi:MAG: transcription antitermination factor NusB [Rhodospirillales bacterium]|nr:MAG: transcription antitermination factor NusB [Rhodospirillales bacterium]
MTAAKTRTPLPRRRAVSRLMAVQALYQMLLSGQSEGEVLAQHLAQPVRLEDVGQDDTIAEPDTNHFVTVVREATGKAAELDAMIAGSLSSGWELERLEPLLLSLLRAGVAELWLGKADLPPKAVISEYTDIAKSFYDGPEVGLVNAVLDRLAKTLHETI